MKTIIKILGYCTILAGLTSCYTGQYVSYSDGIYDEPEVQNTQKISEQRAVKNNHFAKEFDRINILKNNDTIMQTPTYNLDNSNSNIVIYTQPQVNYRGYSRYRFDDYYYDDFYDYTYDDYRNGMWRYRRYNRYTPYWNDGFYFGYRGYYDYSNPYYYGYHHYNPYYYTPHYHQNHHWNSHHYDNHHYKSAKRYARPRRGYTNYTQQNSYATEKHRSINSRTYTNTNRKSSVYQSRSNQHTPTRRSQSPTYYSRSNSSSNTTYRSRSNSSSHRSSSPYSRSHRSSRR